MSYYIRYEIDPNDPQKTESNRLKAIGVTFIGFILVMTSFACVLYLISSAIKMFSEAYYGDFLMASSWLLGMVVVVSFPFVFIVDDRKMFFVNIGLCLLLIIGVLGFIIGIAELCNDSNFGILTICLSTGCILLFALLGVLTYRKCNSMNTNFFRDNDVSCEKKKEQIVQNKSQSNRILFCHKCGNKLHLDSNFCSYCGTSIPKEL
jgi:hypothetical protein